MEIKTELQNYTDEQRQDFIVTYNHNQGYEIKEYTTEEIKQEEFENPETGEMELVEYTATVNHIEAWGRTEEELAQAEVERIAHLKLTKREVFLGLYQAKGVTPDQIKAQITDLAALIEFEYANDYYRGNPLIDIVGASLGISPEQLDKFFEFNDWTYLISEPVVDNSEVITEENSVTDDVTSPEDVNNYLPYPTTTSTEITDENVLDN